MTFKMGIIFLLSTALVISDVFTVVAYFGPDSSESTETSEDTAERYIPLSQLPGGKENNPVLKEISKQLRKIKELEMVLFHRYPEMRNIMSSTSQRLKRDVGLADAQVLPTPRGPDALCMCNAAKGEKGFPGIPGIPGPNGYAGLTLKEVENYVRQNAEKLCYEYCPRGERNRQEVEREGFAIAPPGRK